MNHDSSRVLSVLGQGIELVVGTLSDDEFNVLHSNKEQKNDLFLDDLLQPWSEFDDIFHYWGPVPNEAYLQEEKTDVVYRPETYVSIDNLDKNYFGDLVIDNPTPRKKSRYTIISFQHETGFFGEISISNDTDPKLLEVVTDTKTYAGLEFAFILGYRTGNEALDIDISESSTRGTGVQTFVYDTYESSVIFEF